METVEGAQNQMMVEGEEDRISALPDCLLLELLLSLPSTRDAIRTGILSKRWKHLWTALPTLIFKHSDNPLNQFSQNPNSRSAFVSFVDKALAQYRLSKLKKFVLCTFYDSRFKSQFSNWIRYVITRNVEELDFWLLDKEEGEFVLDDQLFFISSCFTDLRLSRCVLNPSGAIIWQNLRSLCVHYANLDEDLIQKILSGSPVLETLELGKCYGFNRLDITSKSIKKLVFAGYMDPEYYYWAEEIVEINAPNILSLTIQQELYLWKLLLLNVPSLVEANLDYDPGLEEPTHREAQEEMLEGFIQSLLHVKEVKIGLFTSKPLYRLEAKGFDRPSNVKLPDGILSDSDLDW